VQCSSCTPATSIFFCALLPWWLALLLLKDTTTILENPIYEDWRVVILFMKPSLSSSHPAVFFVCCDLWITGGSKVYLGSWSVTVYVYGLILTSICSNLKAPSNSYKHIYDIVPPPPSNLRQNFSYNTSTSLAFYTKTNRKRKKNVETRNPL
jgi:hypothetical protein